MSYDRLILDADVDAYISFDNEKVGELQAQGVFNAQPKGNYFLLGGAPTDNNAKMLREGQLKVLKPAIDQGDIKVVGQQWVPEWSAATALRIVEDALTANNNKIDAIVASNDGTAGGAIQALAAQNMAGKVPVSGQDADLAAVKRLIAGTQTMTVYKPLKLIAGEAAQLSVALAKGEKPTFNAQYDNGKKKVDTVLLQPTLLTKSNVDVVIKDGFYTPGPAREPMSVTCARRASGACGGASAPPRALQRGIANDASATGDARHRQGVFRREGARRHRPDGRAGRVRRLVRRERRGQIDADEGTLGRVSARHLGWRNPLGRRAAARPRTYATPNARGHHHHSPGVDAGAASCRWPRTSFSAMKSRCPAAA